MELNWQLTEKLKKYYIIIYTCWNVIAKSEGEIQVVGRHHQHNRIACKYDTNISTLKTEEMKCVESILKK
jgi:hypothetical protein